MSSLRPGSLKVKDPDSIRNAQFNWTAFLGTAAILTKEVVVTGPDSSLTVDSVGLDTTSRKVNYRISGGIRGSRYRVRCRIATNELPQQVQDRSIYVLCEES